MDDLRELEGFYRARREAALYQQNYWRDVEANMNRNLIEIRAHMQRLAESESLCDSLTQKKFPC